VPRQGSSEGGGPKAAHCSSANQTSVGKQSNTSLLESAGGPEWASPKNSHAGTKGGYALFSPRSSKERSLGLNEKTPLKKK